MSRIESLVAASLEPGVSLFNSIGDDVFCTGAVTIAPGAIHSPNWRAMTMRFGVKDKAMFAKVRAEKGELGFV